MNPVLITEQPQPTCQAPFTRSPFLILLIFLLVALSQGQSQENRTALNFDNARQSNAHRVELGPSLLLKPRLLTVEVWAKSSQWHRTTGDNTIISCTQGGGYAIFVQATTGRLMFVAHANGTFQVAFWAVPGNLVNDRWHHLAGTWDGTTARLYVDGVLRGSSAALSTARDIAYGNNSNQLFLGAESAGTGSVPESNRYFVGQIDEIRIWNYARSASEIVGARFNELDVTIPPTGLAAYYRSNQSSGSSLLANHISGAGDGWLVGASFGSGMVLSPHKQASGISVSAISDNSATISLVQGSGMAYYVFIKQTSGGTADPADEARYSENANFSGAAGTAGGGRLVFIRGYGEKTITGLQPGTTYRIHVVSANESIHPGDYLPGTPLRYDRSIAVNNPMNFTTSTGVLPLTWLHFSATPNGKSVWVNWRTGAEVNNKRFSILHSTNGADWITIGNVEPVASPLTTNDYQFTHRLPAGGKNYYRVVQTDLDGRTSSTRAVLVDIRQQEPLVQVYPNPVTHGKVTVQLREPGLVSLIDNTGKVRWLKKCTAGVYPLQVVGYDKGIYYVKAGGRSIPLVVQ